MQLTKKEVVEIMGLALAGYDLDNTPTGNYKKAERYRNNEDKYIRKMEAILQALEDNRILCLVEEPKVGDIVTDVYVKKEWVEGKEWKPKLDILQNKGFGLCVSALNGWEGILDAKTIYRNSTPAYHCKQETQGAE